LKFSDRFSEQREPINTIRNNQKTTITFNKFIRKVRDGIKDDSKFDIAAQFEFYAINCDQCQKENSEIVEMFLIGNKELNLILEKEGTLEQDKPDLILRCPKCLNEKRVIDMRKHITIQGIEPVGDQDRSIPSVYNVQFGRNKDDPLNSFDDDIRAGLDELMNMPTKNKTAKKDLEKYVKEYASVVKKIAKPLSKDYQALLSQGMTLTEVENIQL
jgi:Zn finger protein HypA/HybF involved in hydrogenase expression